MVGQGSVNHNSRKFHAKNTDPERSHLNITYCQENIKAVYHELFDEALERYNAKQTRADRRIEDYYEKIRSGKQEKPFHEIILQVGNRDDMSADSEEGQLAAAVLDEYMTVSYTHLDVYKRQVERTRIEARPGGAAFTEDDGRTYNPLPADAVTSMNLWGFRPSILPARERRFALCLENTMPGNPLRSEFYRCV